MTDGVTDGDVLARECLVTVTVVDETFIELIV